MLKKIYKALFKGTNLFFILLKYYSINNKRDIANDYKIILQYHLLKLVNFYFFRYSFTYGCHNSCKYDRNYCC